MTGTQVMGASHQCSGHYMSLSCQSVEGKKRDGVGGVVVVVAVLSIFYVLIHPLVQIVFLLQYLCFIVFHSSSLAQFKLILWKRADSLINQKFMKSESHTPDWIKQD